MSRITLLSAHTTRSLLLAPATFKLSPFLYLSSSYTDYTRAHASLWQRRNLTELCISDDEAVDADDVIDDADDVTDDVDDDADADVEWRW